MQLNTDTIDDPPLSQAAQWSGWFRANRREPWRQLVTAPTHDDCWAALLDALAQQGERGGDSTVLAAGVDPNHGASPRQLQGAMR